jgi:hypothetical protein
MQRELQRIASVWNCVRRGHLYKQTVGDLSATIKVIGAHSTLQLRPVESRGRRDRTGCRRTGSGCGRTRLLWRHILHVIMQKQRDSNGTI